MSEGNCSALKFKQATIAEPKRGRRRRRICSAYHVVVVVVVLRRGASRLSATAVVGVVSITDGGRAGERTWRRRLRRQRRRQRRWQRQRQPQRYRAASTAKALRQHLHGSFLWHASLAPSRGRQRGMRRAKQKQGR